MPRWPTSLCLAAMMVMMITCALLPCPAHGQPCEPRWLPGGGSPPGVGGRVDAVIMWDPDGPGAQGRVVAVGGDFRERAGGVLARYVATWDPATDEWSALGSGPPDAVYALAVLPNGELVAGGRAGVHRWDGAAWTRIGNLVGWTYALAVLPNGDLVASGLIAWPGGNNIARWDGVQWQALGSGTSTGHVVALCALPNGDLIAGGQFLSAGGVPVQHVARWNGEAWSAMGQPGMNNVSALLNTPEGDVIAGGSGGVIRWDGSAWELIGQHTMVQPFLSNAISELTRLPNGDIVAGGSFVAMNGVPAIGLARWDGASWFALGGGTQDWDSHPSGHVYALTALPDGTVVAGGTFSHAERHPVSHIARWQGTAWTALGGTGLNGNVLDMALHPDGSLIAVGRFTKHGDVPLGAVARWDGATWSSLASAIPPVGWQVSAVTVASDGGVVVGGEFSEIGGMPAAGIARWTGQAWSPLGLGLDAGGWVRALATLPSGDLIAGGSFNSVGGVASGNLARWDGSTWSSLGDVSPWGTGGRVYALLALPDGDLIAGGSHPVREWNVSRWNGESWAALGPFSSGSTPFVYGLAALASGDLVAVGEFTSAQGVPASNIARRDADAVSWSAMGSLNWETYSVLALPDGGLVAGGRFITAGGVPARHIARWNDGDWSPLGEGLGGTSPNIVFALTHLTSGEIVAGGQFAFAGGIPSAYFARWTDTNIPWIARHPQPVDVPAGQAAIFTVTPASGYDPLTYEWTRNDLPLTDGPAPGGSIILGAATDTLTILNIGPADEGDYRAVISNECGQATSNPAPLTIGPGACPADWNNDGVVNSSDISAFITTWLTSITTGDLAADFNADGQVNSADISAFITAWLAAILDGC